jgi:hypothetical protein
LDEKVYREVVVILVNHFLVLLASSNYDHSKDKIKPCDPMDYVVSYNKREFNIPVIDLKSLCSNLGTFSIRTRPWDWHAELLGPSHLRENKASLFLAGSRGGN